MVKLFVYGTLLNLDILKTIVGEVHSIEPDTMAGYSVVNNFLIDGFLYPRIIPQFGGIVQGNIIELSEEQLEKIDIYESDKYKRIFRYADSGIRVQIYIPNKRRKMLVELSAIEIQCILNGLDEMENNGEYSDPNQIFEEDDMMEAADQLRKRLDSL